MIEFTDGMKFDTSGDLRVVRMSFDYYVVGNGMLCPVDGRQEGEALIAKLTKRDVIDPAHPGSMAEQRADLGLPPEEEDDDEPTRIVLPSDCEMHVADMQGTCHTCGIPMGLNDEEWLAVVGLIGVSPMHYSERSGERVFRYLVDEDSEDGRRGRRYVHQQTFATREEAQRAADGASSSRRAWVIEDLA